MAIIARHSYPHLLQVRENRVLGVNGVGLEGLEEVVVVSAETFLHHCIYLGRSLPLATGSVLECTY